MLGADVDSVKHKRSSDVELEARTEEEPMVGKRSEIIKAASLLPEIEARQSSIFKGALLVQLCMSWCATLVPRLEEWFPVERRFTIDRQGRANCVSIGGDYWAA